MPKESLLKLQLKEKMQRINPLLQRNKEEKPQSQTPNLLDNSIKAKPTPIQRISSFLPVMVGTVLIINTAVIVLIITHTAQNNHLTNLEYMLENAYKKYIPGEKSWTQIESVNNKIQLYKDATLTRKDIRRYLDVVITGLPPEIELLKLGYNQNTVTIEFRASSVLSFTKIVSNYLKEKDVSEIELRSAILETTDNRFKIEAGVTFE